MVFADLMFPSFYVALKFFMKLEPVYQGLDGGICSALVIFGELSFRYVLYFVPRSELLSIQLSQFSISRCLFVETGLFGLMMLSASFIFLVLFSHLLRTKIDRVSFFFSVQKIETLLSVSKKAFLNISLNCGRVDSHI